MLSVGNLESTVQTKAYDVRRVQRVYRLKMFQGYIPS